MTRGEELSDRTTEEGEKKLSAGRPDGTFPKSGWGLTRTIIREGAKVRVSGIREATL